MTPTSAELVERVREALREGLVFAEACKGWPSGPTEQEMYERDVAKIREAPAALADLAARLDAAEREPRTMIPSVQKEAARRMRLQEAETRAQAAEARLAKYERALQRISDPTEITGDGVLEDMVGPAKRELDARMRIARRALETDKNTVSREDAE